MVPCQADTTKRTILYIKGEPFRTISSSELLAVTVAIMVFGPESAWRKGSGRVSVTGFTDNLSNAYLIDRFLTTKFPASLVLMELSKQLDKYSLDLDLAWIPREQNEASDDLSKGKYEKFNMENRMEVNFEQMNFLVLRDLLDAAASLDAEVKEKKTSKGKMTSTAADTTPADQRLRLLQPW